MEVEPKIIGSGRQLVSWKKLLLEEVFKKIFFSHSGNKAFEEVTCKLCNSSFNNKKEILAHFQSLKHLALVKSNIGRT